MKFEDKVKEKLIELYETNEKPTIEAEKNMAQMVRIFGMSRFSLIFIATVLSITLLCTFFTIVDSRPLAFIVIETVLLIIIAINITIAYNYMVAIKHTKRVFNGLNTISDLVNDSEYTEIHNLSKKISEYYKFNRDKTITTMLLEIAENAIIEKADTISEIILDFKLEMKPISDIVAYNTRLKNHSMVQ